LGLNNYRVYTYKTKAAQLQNSNCDFGLPDGDENALILALCFERRNKMDLSAEIQRTDKAKGSRKNNFTF
jgi:hypothetical protein